MCGLSIEELVSYWMCPLWIHEGIAYMNAFMVRRFFFNIKWLGYFMHMYRCSIEEYWHHIGYVSFMDI